MYSKNDIVAKIQKWFLEKFNETIDNNAEYLDSGFIDSFEIIDLVVFIESTYHIKFSSDEFNDSRFFKISGLSELIFEKISEK